MTTDRTALARLFPAAALIAAMGMPLAACAQTQAAETETETAAETDVVEAVEATGVESAEAEAQAKADAETEEKEKTPEELAAEADKEELEKLQREANLRAARLKAELAPLQEEKQRIEAELALLNTKQQDAQAEAQREKAQADFESQLELAELSREMQAMQQRFQQMQLETQIASLERQNETAELAAENQKLSAKTAALKAELGLIQAKRSAASIDKDDIQYPAQPLKDGVLTISDRRIPLNGGISRGSADYVTERIHYYNNLDDKAPIFIVIDTNPGGSVMEGYRIVTAMQNSEAPIHVVVKQYAASMAACITTLAEESYAYPNAIILHHQMSSGMRGNLTQQKEQLEEGFEWAKRLANPVADKMGVSYDEFVELMYENNSDGDWAEFADKAKELKWVNHVVEEIRETALVTAPRDRRMPPMFFFEGDTPQDNAPANANDGAMPMPFTQYELFNNPPVYQVKQDGNGNTYYELPPLAPYDYYFLHNPDGRYRIAK
ncbi:MAG: ATP-dependent Clp protease proteolytic subunit [Phycisphaeraceae bacterium]